MPRNGTPWVDYNPLVPDPSDRSETPIPALSLGAIVRVQHTTITGTLEAIAFDLGLGEEWGTLSRNGRQSHWKTAQLKSLE